MGHNEGQALAYGHVKEADGIEGLELLDEHFAAMRKEANGGVSDGSDVEFPEGEDDEGGWDDWDRESDASDESSGWENVSDGGDDDIEISDSEDDEPKRKKAKIVKEVEPEPEAEAADEDVDMDDDSKSVVSAAPSAATEVTKKLSLLAQQKVRCSYSSSSTRSKSTKHNADPVQILTPADFALLTELRLKAAKDLVDTTSSSSAKRKLAALEASKKHIKGGDDADRFLTESEILGPQKKAKADYEERMESIKKGREGREKFGSFKGKKRKEAPSSSTNREKARNKPIMMALQYVTVFRLCWIAVRDQGLMGSARTRLSARRRLLCETNRYAALYILPVRC